MITRPDEYRHANPERAFVDGDEVRGATKFAPTFGDLLAIPRDKLKEGQEVKVLTGGDAGWWELLDLDLHDQAEGWTPSQRSGEITEAEVKALYESNPDTNAYTDAEKSKLGGLEGSKFKGTYVSLPALETAHPTAEAGAYADVDAGAGEDVVRHIWDVDDEKWVAQLGEATAETAASVKQKYESNPDTNAYTDAEKAKLDGVEEAATADQTDAEIEAAYNNRVPVATAADTDPEAPTDGVKRWTSAWIFSLVKALFPSWEALQRITQNGSLLPFWFDGVAMKQLLREGDAPALPQSLVDTLALNVQHILTALVTDDGTGREVTYDVGAETTPKRQPASIEDHIGADAAWQRNVLVMEGVDNASGLYGIQDREYYGNEAASAWSGRPYRYYCLNSTPTGATWTRTLDDPVLRTGLAHHDRIIAELAAATWAGDRATLVDVADGSTRASAGMLYADGQWLYIATSEYDWLRTKRAPLSRVTDAALQAALEGGAWTSANTLTLAGYDAAEGDYHAPGDGEDTQVYICITDDEDAGTTTWRRIGDRTDTIDLALDAGDPDQAALIDQLTLGAGGGGHDWSTGAYDSSALAYPGTHGQTHWDGAHEYRAVADATWARFTPNHA